MPVEIILPKVDMDMATGRISRWYVTDGASVAKGDVLFEIETDKAAMEIDAPSSGTIRNIIGKESIDIPVGEAVAWLYAEGEATADEASISLPVEEKSADRTDGEAVPPPPEPKRSGNGADASTALPASGLPAISPTWGETSQPSATRASPLARRLAREAGVDLASVTGSGPHGRIVRADIETAVRQAGFEPAPPICRSEALLIEGDEGVDVSEHAAPLGPGVRDKGSLDEGRVPDPALKLFIPGSYDLVPHDTMRRTIARRLTEAKSTIPHFYMTLDCEVDALLALRTEINAAAPVRKSETGDVAAYKLSVNDMIVKALALALKAVPDANVSWTEQAMIRHRSADVGVAVSIPGGLVTPIVRNADEKTLSVVSSEMKDLAVRARARRLKPEEYRGGTTTVSNLGMFGIKDFAAVINPPQATILAVGAAEQRAIVRHGAVSVATVMSVTLSTDHRAVDGALAAELLAAFRRCVELPLAMLA